MAAAGSTGGDGARTSRRGRERAPALALAAVGVVALAAAACGDGGAEQADSDGEVVAGAVRFEPTSQFLATASQRSSSEPYRVGVTMGMDIAGGGDEISAEAPVMTGEQDGTSYEMTMDLSEWMEEIPGASQEMSGVDLTIEMAGDPSTLYLRAPMYAQLADQAGGAPQLGPAGELAALGDGWGRVDVAALGDLSLTDVQSTVGSPGGADPRVMLDLVASAEDVEELGTDSVDGTGVNGLGADVTMGDLLEAQGMDVDEFVQQTGANVGGMQGADPSTAAELTQTMVDAEIPFEVWVDGDGYVRRVSYEMDLLDIFEGGAAGGLRDQGLEDFVITQTMDFSDYGDEGIQVELPPPGAESATDVTEAYRRMLEAGQAGQAGQAGPSGLGG
jgi:hypothetical protein